MSRLFCLQDRKDKGANPKPYQRQFIEFALNWRSSFWRVYAEIRAQESPISSMPGCSMGDLALLGRFCAEALVDSGIDFDLFGPADKGIPIATTTAVALAEHHDRDVPYCFNRKEAKTTVKAAIWSAAIRRGA